MQSQRRTFKVTETAGAEEMDETVDHVCGGPAAHQRHQLRGEAAQMPSASAGIGARAPAGHYLHHHLPPPPPSSLPHQPQATIGSSKQQQQVPLGNKDLIIRMLAEIFQVRQDENGQVRWHQVSTSLVPISLYSRTTSKWLDYLLTAPLSVQANDPANTMSPDSRDFLLLLQQFHQQTRPIVSSGQQQLRSSSMNSGGGNQQRHDAIVFQVVGHDFIDGQCRKILNVKIRQPGTRLGQASDYFVYWKDQSSPSLASQQSKHYNLHRQQFSASSYASNAPMMQTQPSLSMRLQPASNAQMLNPIHMTQQYYDRQQQFKSSHQHQQTWGLNFASMNDAKLFYDICSLNIVNLDFNSEYLKQLSISDGRLGSPSQKQQHFSATATGTMSPCSLMLNQRRSQPRPRISGAAQSQQQQHRLMKTRTTLRTLKQDTLTQGHNLRHSPGGQSSMSRCPSCKQALVFDEHGRHSLMNKETASHTCPVHGRQSEGTIRARSRSTTRQPLSTCTDLENFARTRSFSTPASPEPDQCPVHRHRHRTNTECEARDRRQTLEYLKRDTSRSEQQYEADGLAGRIDEGPEKPARGFLRLSYLLDSHESVGGRRQQHQQQQGVSSTQVAQHEQETPDRLLYSKPNTKTIYMGYLHNVAQQQSGRDQQMPADQLYRGENVATPNSNFEESVSGVPGGGLLTNRSLFRRMQTGTETFDAVAHRDARLARAQYANSRNMKEFLSLDAGGLQSAFPTEQRFHHRKQARQSTTRQPMTTTTNINGECKNDAKLSEVHARSSLPPQVNNAIDKSGARSSGGEKSDATKPTTAKQLIRTGSSDAAGNEQADANVCADPARAAVSVQCNASTTTDDLPMDSSIRKRMFKLTSDEIISERTEPRSVSTSRASELARANAAPAASGQQQPPRGEKLDLPVRAVSLGPTELSGDENKIRGREARSDAGRRRSLERSVCVDLDSAMPASSLKKKQLRLLPLAQSSAASPQQAIDETSGANSPEPPVRDSSRAVANEEEEAVTDMNEKHLRYDDQIYGMGHYNRQPLYSMAGREFSDRQRKQYRNRRDIADNISLLCASGGEDVQLISCETRSGNTSGRQLFTSENQQLATFKSAPDMRRLDDERAQLEERILACNAHNAKLGGNLLGDECNDGTFEHRNSFEGLELAPSQQRRPQLCFGGNAPRATIMMGSLGRSNLSSYAVPLCTTVKRGPQGLVSRRQCYSCPNSLRRKRRPPSANSDPHQGPLPANYSDGDVALAYLPAHVDNCCSYQSSGAYMPYNDLVRVEAASHNAPLFACCGESINMSSAAVNYPDCAHIRGLHDHACHLKHPKQQLMDESHWYHHRAIHHHHLGHHQLPASTKPPPALRDDSRREEMRTGLLVCPYEQHQQKAAHADDESFHRGQPNQSSRPHSSQSVRSPMQYGLYESDCDVDVTSPVRQQFYGVSDCHTGDNLHQQQRSARSIGSHTSAFVVQPVQGYDQTMSRACLKSRQRSRSQPPSSNDDDENDGEQKSAQHLTKSMENVEKLIKEVQNQLRALKRQPLGAAHIDMKTEMPTKTASDINQTFAKKTFPSAPGDQQHRDSIIKMSHEEDEAKTRQKQQQQLSYSSATRRAGQFKCVGAIRKAGFLSVKKWILKRRQSIELARKQGWRRYWVCLRGTALLFHSVIDTKNQNEQIPDDANQENQRRIDLSTWIRSNCSSQLNFMAGLLQAEASQENLSQEAFFKNMSQCYIEDEPRHLIIIDGAIAQPIPEHPRRDFVFCLSTTFGDAYLFQAGCQLESDNWISAIHNACAASIARDLIRDEAIKLFETKIRHFELEAEKKLFLRHRLESRLTSMSSMCNISKPMESQQYCKEVSEKGTNQQKGDVLESSKKASASQLADGNKKTMRSLLYQLSQQLLALDSYIEQLHCEIYQLRCYLSSCSAQNIFYHNLLTSQGVSSLALAAQNYDLPHPKSLLMHVSKPTKLLLIKLGVFTVSSFHAFIHARQESAKSIFQTIQTKQSSCPESPIVELRIRSQSISESLMSRSENVQLANETENLIEMTNLKTIPIVLSRTLFNKLRGQQHHQQHGNQAQEPVAEMEVDASDDRYSIEDRGKSIKLNVKLNSRSNSSSIIKQVLKILNSNYNELEFLNYYLRLVVQKSIPTSKANNATTNDPECATQTEEKKEEFFVVKQKETLEDWSNYAHIELLEKIVFRVELTRSRMDEEETTVPFGISVEGQLLSSKSESLLNVYCSYIEWGSVADKAGLQDEDEFLMLNGILVGDLDLMFVECIIQDAQKLRAVIRSNRCECPPRSRRLDQTSWRSLDGDGFADGERDQKMPDQQSRFLQTANNNRSFVSQVISDEYLTSLVCPPPPAKSSAFLRTDTNMLRQKSDLGLDRPRNSATCDYENEDEDELKLATSGTSSNPLGLPKSRSQHRIDTTSMDETRQGQEEEAMANKVQVSSDITNIRSSADLARQLIQKTERITMLLGAKEDLVANVEPDRNSWAAQISSASLNSKSANHNQVERLKKSILELIETEYAYIRHLETISEHYMLPLCETRFLNIIDLRSFSQTVSNLLKFQHEFFSLLTKKIFEQISDAIKSQNRSSSEMISDDFERFNWIVQQADSSESVDSFKPLLTSIANAFSSEAGKFKIYASYCVAYSKLQRILHPTSAVNAANFQGASTIISIPNSLNTFANSLGLNMSGIGNMTSGQHRDMKLLSLNGIEDRTAQLKQLTDFLGNLDSSSSSASFSLQRSSASDQQQRNTKMGNKPDSFTSPSAGCNNPNYRLVNNSIVKNGSYQRTAHHQNFESYLIKPIQRIVKYPMLLNSIALVVQNQSNEPFYNDLQGAIKQFETVINHVNESQRVHDEYGIIFDHIERQFFEHQAIDSGKNTVATLFGPHQPPISLNIAQLLYSGQVSWLNLNEFTSKAKKSMNLSSILFVFETCVVFICKEQIKVSGKKKIPFKGSNESQTSQAGQQQQSSGLTSRMLQWSTGASGAGATSSGEQVNEIVRYQTLIPVSEVQVRSVSSDVNGKRTLLSADNNKTTSAQFKWELFQCSSSNSNSSLLTKSSSSNKQQQHTHQRNSNTGKIYLLSSPSNEERSAFLRKIRFTIRESVRNMSLPTVASTKSSLSNKSLALKKLSTSSASSATSNMNVNTSASLSPPESSGGLELVTQDQSTTIKCEPYNTKQVNKTSIEVKT